jgi:hypothetical protein
VNTNNGGKDRTYFARDPYGSERAAFDPSRSRFAIYVVGHEPDEEDGWRYKLSVIDYKYNDSDAYPIDAIAGGNSWAEAFARAAEMIEYALAADHCIF